MMVEADPVVKPQQGLARVLENFPDLPETLVYTSLSSPESVM